jgi:hypothetical protein
MLQQQQHQQQQQFQQHQQQYITQQMAQAQQLPGTAQHLLAPQQQQPATQPFYFQMPPYQPPTPANPDALSQGPMHESFQNPPSTANEIRLILLVVIVTIVIQIIPIDALIHRVHILGKVPYSHIFVKAALAGILFFAIRKYVS